MLDAALKTQLQAYLTKVTRPVEIRASLDDGDSSRQMRDLLQEIVSLSPLLSYVEASGSAERKPSFQITRPGMDIGIQIGRASCRERV